MELPPSPSIPHCNLAPRKRKITARMRDNADPLLPKNKKARAEASANRKTKQNGAKANTLKAQKQNKANILQRRLSVEVEEESNDSDGNAGSDPREPNFIEQSMVDSSDAIDVDEEPSDAIDVNENPSEVGHVADTSDVDEIAEESCEAELSKTHFPKVF